MPYYRQSEHNHNIATPQIVSQRISNFHFYTRKALSEDLPMQLGTLNLIVICPSVQYPIVNKQRIIKCTNGLGLGLVDYNVLESRQIETKTIPKKDISIYYILSTNQKHILAWTLKSQWVRRNKAQFDWHSVLLSPALLS